MTGKRKGPPPEKRPPITHFLCLPLVNLTSIPQLEASIAAFKKDNPPVPVAGLLQNYAQSSRDASRPPIPEGAIRPLGTLHLTLGVMSLPSKRRLDEAISFLRSLDLAKLMHEAEQVALRKKKRNSPKPATDVARPPKHLSISLESLHALPRANSATVLHASPVDSTGRLYPFCLMLRDKFLEAGFLIESTGNTKNKEPAKSSDPNRKQNQPGSSSARGTTELDPYAAALTRQSKLRPLLLHATIVNTIYVRQPKPARGSSNSTTQSAKGKKTVTRFEFDARKILDRYKDYYADEARTVPRRQAVSTPPSASVPAKPKYPFVWAKTIPIDSVTICEMGAKKLDLDGDSDGLKARLGQEYTTVARQGFGPR
ncbi:hypothetical protein N7507_011365 [Penicillium longicatenatum]|nr:hypothetical protein N7507_011365 [Penicillium longicatenatum]